MLRIGRKERDYWIPWGASKMCWRGLILREEDDNLKERKEKLNYIKKTGGNLKDNKTNWNFSVSRKKRYIIS